PTPSFQSSPTRTCSPVLARLRLFAPNGFQGFCGFCRKHRQPTRSAPGVPMVRRRAATVLFSLLPALAGCTHFVIKPPCAEFERRPSDAAAEESKSCVYIFLIDPLNPFEGGGLSPMCEELHKLGFGKTFHGRSVHVSYFVEKMRSI